ncbi:MAG: rhomboid family intramembrane serine protease [Gammaproteobacteria bacterium]|nr:MAG: rhomboid family intramembrane serine protease [Gammaproteobacteria bacterium]RLA33382.1 MAG: rhomboid family intramembrane serine protease [Gammaproteobacteria bacterium]
MLHAVSIPYEIVADENSCALIVPDNMAEKAKYELWQYDTENRKPDRRNAALIPKYQNGIWGVAVYVVVICLVAWLAAEATFNRDWFAAGRIDGALIRAGEWWRSVTALTLHSGIRHLMGNIGFGILFGLMAGALVGPGVAWLAIVLSSSAANILNTVLLESSHRAIGASTAVFAALGLVAGYSWRAKLMAQDSWPRRLGPIIGGVALLAYTGTGDANTDIGAHLAGFVCGFFSGVMVTRIHHYLPQRNIQRAAGITAVALIVLAWTLALNVWV